MMKKFYDLKKVNKIIEDDTKFTLEKSSVDLVKYLEAIPDKMKRGRAYLVKCPCGGTLCCIRSTYNGHLRAKCESCGFSMIE